MRVSGFTKVAWLMSLAVLVPNPFSISAFASDHEDPLSKTTVLRQIEAQPASASSSVFQPAPVSVPIPFTIGSSTPEQAGGVQVANDSPNYDTPKDKDEPGRRALPAPLDGIFPSAEYLGPSPLIGVPDTDPIYPLTKALWSTFPALKRAKIKLYGWANLSVNASTSDKSNIPESYATVPNRLDGGEDRASRICDGARIRTVHRTLVNGTLGFSCRGDTRRTGHGPGARRFTDRFAAQAFLLEVAFLFAASFCGTGYRADLLDNSFQPFALIVLTALAMGTRNAAVRKLAIPDLTTTVLTLTITGIGEDASLAKGTNPRLGRRVGSVAAMFLGAALGAVVMHYSISVALWLAAAISAACSAALFRSVRTSDKL